MYFEIDYYMQIIISFFMPKVVLTGVKIMTFSLNIDFPHNTSFLAFVFNLFLEEKVKKLQQLIVGFTGDKPEKLYFENKYHFFFKL